MTPLFDLSAPAGSICDLLSDRRRRAVTRGMALKIAPWIETERDQ